MKRFYHILAVSSLFSCAFCGCKKESSDNSVADNAASSVTNAQSLSVEDAVIDSISNREIIYSLVYEGSGNYLAEGCTVSDLNQLSVSEDCACNEQGECQVSLVPNYDFYGTASFQFKLSREGFETSNATVTVNISPPASLGLLSSDFGQSGMATINADNTNLARHFAISDSEQIVLTGDIGDGVDTDYFVARLNSDGSLDTTFGTSGIYRDDYSGGQDETSYGVAINESGEIYHTGFSHVLAGPTYTTLQKLDASGSLMTDFQASGYAVFDYSTDAGVNDRTRVRGIKLESSGRLYLIGHSKYAGGVGAFDGWILRVDADGNLDPDFSGDGFQGYGIGSAYDVIWNFGSSSDGDLIMSGYIFDAVKGMEAICMKADADGNFDNTFGSNGVVTISYGNGDDRIYDQHIYEDGKILLAGSVIHPTNGDEDFFFARLLPDGSFDPSFGNGGSFIYSFSSHDDRLSKIAILPSGQIVFGGVTSNGIDEDAIIGSINDNGTVDTSFATNGAYVFDSGHGNDKIEQVLTFGLSVYGVGVASNATGSEAIIVKLR